MKSGENMSSGQVLKRLDELAKDSRFSAMSALDLQNILSAIELCSLSFSRGPRVAEKLNRILKDEWPGGSKAPKSKHE